MVVRIVASCVALGVLIACGGGQNTIADCADEGNKLVVLYHATLADLTPIVEHIKSPIPATSELDDSAAMLGTLADTLEDRGAWPTCGDETRGHFADAAQEFADAAQSRAVGDFEAYAERFAKGLESLQQANTAIQQ